MKNQHQTLPGADLLIYITTGFALKARDSNSEDDENTLKIPGVHAKNQDWIIYYPDNLSAYRSDFNSRCKWGDSYDRCRGAGRYLCGPVAA